MAGLAAPAGARRPRIAGLARGRGVRAARRRRIRLDLVAPAAVAVVLLRLAAGFVVVVDVTIVVRVVLVARLRDVGGLAAWTRNRAPPVSGLLAGIGVAHGHPTASGGNTRCRRF